MVNQDFSIDYFPVRKTFANQFHFVEVRYFSIIVYNKMSSDSNSEDLSDTVEQIATIKDLGQYYPPYQY